MEPQTMLQSGPHRGFFGIPPVYIIAPDEASVPFSPPRRSRNAKERFDYYNPQPVPNPHKVTKFIRRSSLAGYLAGEKRKRHIASIEEQIYKMLPDPQLLKVPESYSELEVQHITISNHPPNADGVTPVQIVTLNRPKNRNAFTLQMMRDVELCFPLFNLDERVKCIVLTGAGDTFCAGADLDIGFNGSGERERLLDHRDSGGRLNLAIFRCRKPTIVALNGSAVGLGMTLTLAAAIRIAHASSKYGFVFSRRGITMESNSSYFLPRLIGYSNAVYLLTTGDVFRGDSKYFRDLFQEVVEEKGKVLERALELATNLAENTSGLASYLNRELIWRNPGSVEETHLLDSAVLYHMFANRDCEEGVKSFFEKRKPQFKATLEKDGPPVFPWWREVDTGSRPRIFATRHQKL